MTGERGEILHRNRGEQPDEGAEDRSTIFPIIIWSHRFALNCIIMGPFVIGVESTVLEVELNTSRCLQVDLFLYLAGDFPSCLGYSL